MYVIIRDQGGVPIIADCNGLFLERMGYRREEVLEQGLTDFLHPSVTLRSGG